MKKILFIIAFFLFAASVCGIECAYEECAPYLSEDIRGSSYMYYMQGCNFMTYPSWDLHSNCKPEKSEEDRWYFTYLGCETGDCYKWCFECDAYGKNCNYFQYSNWTQVDCPGNDCECPQPGFPQCETITGNSCVDEMCCVGQMDFKNHGEYVSCVADALRVCEVDDPTLQREAAKTKFNPSIFIDVVVTLTLVGVVYLIFKKK